MFSLEFVNRRVPPAIAPSVFGELKTESVKEVLSSNQRRVPKARNAALIGSDGKFTLKHFQHSANSSAPAFSLLHSARSDKVHGAGQINTAPVQKPAGFTRRAICLSGWHGKLH